ncbi:MAG: hypothetical protein ACOCWC_02870 [Bacteroidota bacterium]
MIDNYKELIEVKKELQNRIHETEHTYIRQYESINYFLDMAGVYKGKKNEKEMTHFHSLIIQCITKYLEEQEVFKKYNKEDTFFFISLALSLISAFIVKKV